MGAGQSIPGTLTREKVFELTKSTRGLMDVLLEYMLKELTVRDFLALSNPTECKKYVIFMANNLYKYFYELQIVPTKDKKGLIAFRPVKDLVNPPENDEQERQSLCLTLAYFYTRIFQIYGALALTLLDDSKYMTQSGFLEYGDTTKKGLLPPGYTAYTAYTGGTSEATRSEATRSEATRSEATRSEATRSEATRSEATRSEATRSEATRSEAIKGGGPIPAISLGYFNFLRTFLIDSKEDEKGYLSLYSGEGDSRGLVYFSPRVRELNEYGRQIVYGSTTEVARQKGLFYIAYTGARKFATLEFYAKQDGIGGDIKATFDKFKYFKKDGTSNTITLPSDVLVYKPIYIETRRPDATSGNIIYKIKDSELSIKDYFNKILNKVVAYHRKLEDAEAVTSGVSIASEFGTDEALRLARTIQNLTKTKPLGHCLARALQLLSTLPLKGEAAVSHICKAKFFEHTVTSASGTKTVISRSGIPEPGTSLDTSPGMAALAQLFYDTVIIGTPKVVIGTKPGPNGSPSSMQKYISFMKTMSRLFGDTKGIDGNPKSNSDLKEKGLAGIKNRRDKDLCKDSSGKEIAGDIVVPRSITGNVYDVVNQMYKVQLQHATECGKIINQLFKVERDKSSGRYRIALSDNIIKKGFPEIERINFLARDTLINYYSTCELKYLQGMKIVLDAKRKTEPIVIPSTTTIPTVPVAPGVTI
jgi:hypothetical protein